VAPNLSRRTGLVALVALTLGVPATAPPSVAAPARAAVAADRGFQPGAPGIGDPYFPRDGNGGYDVRHYALSLRYQPTTGRLAGAATIRARATQNLSRFNLDLDGLRVRSVRVNSRPATWTRHGGELTIDPNGPGLRRGKPFRSVIRYDGRPRLFNQSLSTGGFFHTDDGAMVAGQPHAASAWFPADDHPSDKATYTFRVSAPKDLQVVANGVLTHRHTTGELRTWTWQARAPMASYLATIGIGHFRMVHYRKRGIRYWDAIDSRLFRPPASPRTGQQFAISRKADSSYKRLTHTIHVPASGAQLSFWVTRGTELNWDYFFVEAHTARQNDWTTLPDANGHTSSAIGDGCPFWLELHPFLTHYQTERKSGGCTPRGRTGTWHAASGRSHGPENWVVDLSPYAGRTVEVSISQASDDGIQLYGAFVDDITVSTGEGNTSFEADGDILDGWTVRGPPAGSPGNTNDWFVGTAAQVPPTQGVIARQVLRRQPEILRFLAKRFGRYPTSVAGGMVDLEDSVELALETQTRPVYDSLLLTDPTDGASVVLHELTHQWFGDSLRLRRWRDIWLNEGFATYAEWMWSAHEHGDTPAQIAASVYRDRPADDPFWKVRIGNPGRDTLFDAAVYLRGALTLHRLRQRVGDHAFFRILHRWTRSRAGEAVTAGQFIRLTERVSGEHLRGMFHTWLYTRAKPPLPHTTAPGGRIAAASPTPRTLEWSRTAADSQSLPTRH
jgi:hypothetical protein